MIAFGHTSLGFIIGYSVAQNTQDPAAGIVAAATVGILSHYVADFIPHGHLTAGKKDPYSGPLVYLDVILSFLFFATLATYFFGVSLGALIVIAGMSGGLFPDIISVLAFKFKWLGNTNLLKLENKFHDGVLHWHGHGDNALRWGKRDIWQVAVFVFASVLPFLYKLI